MCGILAMLVCAILRHRREFLRVRRLCVACGYRPAVQCLWMSLARWWIPATQLSDPNILATPFPAVSSIYRALQVMQTNPCTMYLLVCVHKDLADLCVLQAATFEECIFRAFPVGAAVWYGRRRATLAARPKLLLWAAFAAQVVVFAGAHANYPGQVWGVGRVQVLRRAFPPTYTSHAACVRSSGGADGAVCRAWINVFTVCMLGLTRRCAIRPLLTCCGDRHGLFAPVVAHFVYDLVWVAMPLFLVVGRSEFAVWAGQALVVALGMLPLAVCVWQRLRQRERDSGSTTENAAYLPPTATADTPAPRSIMASNQAPTARASRLLAVAAVGAVGLLVCFGVGHPTDVPQVRISRSAAILRASDAIGTAAV